jgi:ATP-dependent HslUV protease ATP-binding subunit HslU
VEDTKIEDALSTALKPREVVDKLDEYIVGQAGAKRAVAIALRNRWRRHRLPEDLRNEVNPKNILMIGPTGCGKTEIARRMAKLSDAPFIKVEATKFTEVGFHGRDVDSIIRDLVDISIALTKKLKTEKLQEEVAHVVEDKILDALIGAHAREDSRQSFRLLLRLGNLDEREIEVEVPPKKDQGNATGAIAFDPSGPVPINDLIGKLGKMMNKKPEKRKMPISEARPLIEEIELDKLLDLQDVTREAVQAVEDNGIVFIDEIDKICNAGDRHGADASAEGVQRDLLPIIEGSIISTKHGNVNTEHILFVASGAFHSCKPSDMMAELQGRLPIRVELQGLTEDDMYRILTEPVTNLLRQHISLLATEGVELKFEDDAIREIARVATEVNRTVENIGARRLHTVLERIVEEISYEASEYDPDTKLVVDKAMVVDRLGDLLKKMDHSKFIL